MGYYLKNVPISKQITLTFKNGLQVIIKTIS